MFEIGNTYENRKGVFKVLEVRSESLLVIYEDSTQTELNIAIQQRILERMQVDKDLQEEEQRKQAVVNYQKVDFNGLLSSDFKDNVSGTSWRSRSALGGLIAQQLSEKSSQAFQSQAIYRMPRFFVFPPHLPMDNQEEGVKLPKFIVRTNPNDILFGFYIEKSNGPMSDAWFWPKFVRLLSEQKWQDFLSQLISDVGIEVVLQFEKQIDPDLGYQGYALSDEIIYTDFDSNNDHRSVPEFARYLRDLPESEWCNLYFAKRISKDEAVKLGTQIGTPITTTLHALCPLMFKLLEI